MLIISVLVILLGTKRRSALLLVLIPSCFTATVGERSSTDTAAEECLFAAVRSWVACRNYDTFLCHRLSRSQTHVDIHTLAPHVFIHSFIQRHRHTAIPCHCVLPTSTKRGTSGFLKRAQSACSFTYYLVWHALLGLTLPLCVTECMCGSRTVTWRWIIHSLLQRYRGPLPTKSASMHVFVLRVCVHFWCLCGWLSAPLHLSLCSPIHYPQHLAAKACKEDISLGKCFLKAVTQGTANHRSHTSSNLHSYWELLA